jgi:hypothetical protein
MSTADRLSDLEALVRKNKDKVEELEHTNWLLQNYNTMQQEEMSKFEDDLGISIQELDQDVADLDKQTTPPFRTESSQARLMPPPSAQSSRCQPSWLRPPNPPPTPFYLAAQETTNLQLDFVIPGYHGKTLGQSVNNVDQVFMLQQTLRRRGWGKVMTRRVLRIFWNVRWGRLLGGGERVSLEDCS